MTSWWSRRRTGYAAAVAVPALVAGLALVHQGFPVSRLDLDDGGVWLTSQADLALGRFNVPVGELDGGIGTTAAGFDVAQDGGDVLLVEGAKVSVVDPATVAVTDRVTLGAAGTVQVAAGTVLVTVGTSVWTRPIGRVSEITANTPADQDLGAGGRAVLARDGTVLTVAGDGTVGTRAPGTATAGPDGHLSGPVGSIDQLTSVGDEPVALDGSTVRTRTGAVTLDGTGLVLQQPGPAADTVLVAGHDALYEVPLDGGAPTERRTGSSGTPAAPVRLGACEYGAWAASTGNWVRVCGGQADTADREQVGSGDQLVFRVNRTHVVLNDVATGRAWVPDDTAVKTPDWQQIAPQPTRNPDQDQGDEATRTQSATCSEQGNPPIATDDRYGVRAGRTTTLHVLADDSTSDCGILVITAVDALPAAFGTVSVAEDGRALQVAVAPGATGSTTFTYTVADRPGVRAPATARVTLTVHDAAENSPPVQVDAPTLQVGQGGTLSTDVLADFVDPDGDPLALVGATMDAAYGSLSYRPDGTLTITASGQVGSTQATVQVTDGRIGTPVTGHLEVDVREGSLDPVVDPVHEVTFVRQPLVVEPLKAVRGWGTAPVRLAGVGEAAGATIVPDLAAGTFTFTAARAGTYYVSFTVVSSPNQTVGWARIDVQDFPPSNEPPVATADVAYLPAGGMATVDPLANDEDPNGLVLVLQSTTVPDGSGLQAAIVDHDLVEITATRTLTVPTEVAYAVSDGTSAATGTILVVPVPPSANDQPPVVRDREVTVRTGGVVTVDVLTGAYDPDGSVVTLDPTLPEPLAAGKGLLFVSGDVLRYQAPVTAMTVTATFRVRDALGATTAARLTVHVHATNAQTKPAPTPKNLLARVFSGETVRIPVPLTGIDADGDGVTLLGLGGDAVPQHGVVTAVGADYLDYKALTGAVGTDTFTYAVEDWTGQRAVATIRVGIAARPSDAPVVVARDDAATVLPGSTVEVSVLDNDVDSAGDPLTLDPTLDATGDVGTGAGAASVRVSDGLVVVTAPRSPGILQVQYTARDARGGQDSAVLTVTVSADAPVRSPVAKDVIVPATDTIGRTQVRVDVLAVASNPSGPLSELAVVVPGTAASTASVTADRKVLVTLTDQTQIIPYQLVNTRDRKANSYAFVTVPALGFFPPVARPKAPALRVGSGRSIDIDLGEQVQVAPGRSPTLADASSLHGTSGTATAVDASTVRFTADAGYAGAASVTLRVTDALGANDAQARQSTLTLPVTVYSVDQQEPTFDASTLTVGPGDTTQVDLTSYLKNAEGETPKDSDYTFTRTGAVPAGFTATLTGSTLTVGAAATTAKGTTGALAITIGYGTSGTMTVSLPLRVVASTKPLARVLDVQRTGQAGRPVTVSVLDGAYDPFASAGGGLTVVDAVVETAGSGSASFSAGSVTVTPDAGFVGDMVTRFVVRDATGDPDRQVEGRITLQVAAVPGAPSAPRVTEVSDQAVGLAWTAPDGRGAPVTGYRVTASPGGRTSDCPATTCTVSGLTNGTTYTFTVAAQNSVGWSDPSAASAAATPDAVPDAPDAPALRSGNGTVQASWTVPGDHGSAIVSYEVEISPAPDDSSNPSVIRATTTTARFSGLTNGRAYAVRVRAYNSSPQPGPWSDWSAQAVPATAPDVPSGFTATRTDSRLGGEIDLAWNVPASNGAALGAYVLQIVGGGTTRTVHPGSSDTSYAMTGAVNGVPYTFTLQATNSAGTSDATTVTASTYGVPDVPVVTGVVGHSGGAFGAGTATVTWDAPADNGSPITGYQVSVDGGSPVDVGTATSDTISSLKGGTSLTAAVLACNAAGCSALSAARASSPDPATVPGTVGNLQVQVTTDPKDGTPTLVSATWSAPDWAGGTSAQTYLVSFAATGQDTQTFTQCGTQVRFTKLPTLSKDLLSAQLTVTVSAQTDVGVGVAASASRTVGWIAPPADVTGLTVTDAGLAGRTATWAAVAGADHYEWQLVSDSNPIGSVGTVSGTSLSGWTLVGNGIRVRAVAASGATSPDWTTQHW